MQYSSCHEFQQVRSFLAHPVFKNLLEETLCKTSLCFRKYKKQRAVILNHTIASISLLNDFFHVLVVKDLELMVTLNFDPFYPFFKV